MNLRVGGEGLEEALPREEERKYEMDKGWHTYRAASTILAQHQVLETSGLHSSVVTLHHHPHHHQLVLEEGSCLRWP